MAAGRELWETTPSASTALSFWTPPAWVAMRAAECLVTRHATAVEPEMTSWMGDSQKKGLGFLALDHLDAMEPALATRIATAAMAGPYRDEASLRIARSHVESVRTLAIP